MQHLDVFLRKLGWVAVQFSISLKFPKVQQISTTDLATWLEENRGQKPLLLDARTQEEYEVSHLLGALLASSHLQDLLERDKLDFSVPIVVYCSVGYRSAAIAQQLQKMGYKNVFNLKGSIFQWFNRGRPVYQKDRVVAKVHPYNKYWKFLLAPAPF